MGQEVMALKIGTGPAIGIVAALFRPGPMDGAPFTEPVIGEKDTGAVSTRFEGVLTLQVTSANFAVGNSEMPGQPVDIFGQDIEGSALKPVTAVSRAVMAVNRPLAGAVGTGGNHQRKSSDLIPWRRMRRWKAWRSIPHCLAAAETLPLEAVSALVR